MHDVYTVAGSALQQVKTISAALQKHSPHRLRILESERDLRFLEYADRVLLLGGADINPNIYGQRRMPYTGTPVTKRDALEFALAEHALNTNTPVLGICRGHQMLAAVAGGTLHQDLEQDAGVSQRRHGTSHSLIGVTLPLRDYLPTATVNSYHHQAVNDLPPGFEVAAWSPDGIIEAIYRPGALGVQWHPEMLWSPSNGWSALFHWFIRDGLEPPYHTLTKSADFGRIGA